YHRFVVDKPLRILGDGAGTVGIQTFDFELEAFIHDIGPGRELVLSGIAVRGSMFLQNCAGTVILQDLTVDPEATWSRGGDGILVDHCARAVLLDSRVFVGDRLGASTIIVGASGVVGLDSTLWIANTEISGIDRGGTGVDPGVTVVRSTLHLWRTS